MILSKLVKSVFLGILFVQTYACAKEVTLCEVDNGKNISLEVGDTVEIHLEGNPTTGYTWDVSQIDNKILGLIGKSYTPTEHAPGIAGSGGTFTFRIHACDVGASELHLKYARVWEKGVPPVKTFDVSIEVHQG